MIVWDESHFGYAAGQFQWTDQFFMKIPEACQNCYC